MRWAFFLYLGVSAAACGSETAGPNQQQQAAASITIDSPPTNLVPNEEIPLQPVVRAADGREISNATVMWRTSDAGVATVSGTSVLRGVAAGTATITASSGSATVDVPLVVDQGGFVAVSGGTVTGFSGAVLLVVPPGALAAPTAIRIRAIPAPTPDPTFVRGSGAAVVFEGNFAVPAQLTLNYPSAELPAGLPDARLGLRRLDGAGWTLLSGGTVDVNARTVRGPITGPGNYGVGMAQSAVPCTAAEHRQFDFRAGTFTWAGPAGLSGEATVTAEPSGCSLFETLQLSTGAVTRAVFFFEPGNNQWHYTSISGSVTTRISGGLENGRMILYNVNRRSRVVWEQASSSAHTQAGESSPDGTTWTRGGLGTYTSKTGSTGSGNVITPAGGTLTLADGAITLQVPSGAVSANTTVQVAASSTFSGPLDASMVRGLRYTLATSPAVTFAAPVTVSLAYDPANGPSGVPESDFRLAVESNNAWQAVAGGQVDTAANRVAASVTTLGTFAAYRPPAATACSAAEHRQFDFWIGEWLVGPTESSITREPSGCAVFEFWKGQLPGKSINVYDPRTRQWHQTYLTSMGATVLIGNIDNARMVLYGRNGAGQLISRWTWERVDANTVTQRAESTQNNGTTWTQGFFGTYRRR